MDEAVLEIHFPLATLPARGFRCPVCRHERLLMDDAERAQEAAHRLGAYGPESGSTRSLIRIGGSVAVTLDPDLARAVLGTLEPGTRVNVGRQGGQIVIGPAPTGRARPRKDSRPAG